jgi:hypothetical protein
MDVNGSLHKSFEGAISTDYNILYVESKPTPLLEEHRRTGFPQEFVFCSYSCFVLRGEPDKENARQSVSRVLSRLRDRSRGWPFLWDVRCRTPRATDPSGGAEARPASGDACRSYLVLLPVGFSLPPPLPAARCALTAPFHPCRPPGRDQAGAAVSFLWHFPWGRPRRALPGTVPPWSPDFPLPASCVERPSDRLATRSCGTASANVKASGRGQGRTLTPLAAAKSVTTLPANSGLISTVAFPAVAATAAGHAK